MHVYIHTGQWLYGPVANILMINLTPFVQETKYSVKNSSISCLLMAWRLTLPSHQHRWYWLHKVYRFLSYQQEIFTTCITLISSNGYHKVHINLVLSKYALMHSTNFWHYEKIFSNWYLSSKPSIFIYTFIANPSAFSDFCQVHTDDSEIAVSPYC